jgi:hypothetical protein
MIRIIGKAVGLLIGGSIAMMPAIGVLLYREVPSNYDRREILTPKVPPGGTLRILIEADITKDCDAIVYRTIVSSAGYVFELEPEKWLKTTNYIIEVPVPLGITPGPAEYAAEIDWRCNIVQQFFPKRTVQRKLRFEVVPSEEQLPIPQQQGIYPMPHQNLAKVVQ